MGVIMKIEMGRRSMQGGAAWLTVLVGLVIGLAAYGGWRYQQKVAARALAAAELRALEDFDKRLAVILRQWGDAYQLAVSSPRIAVPVHIAAIQATARELDALPDILCVAKARAGVRHIIQGSIDGLLAFVRQDAAARDLIASLDVEAGPAAEELKNAKAACAASLRARMQ
jgi:hypothetical protein